MSQRYFVELQQVLTLSVTDFLFTTYAVQFFGALELLQSTYSLQTMILIASFISAFFQRGDICRACITYKGDPSLQLIIQQTACLHPVLFKAKSGRWFLSTKFQIQMTFTCVFQESTQDLTFFSFLEENCYIGWRTYKSAANTESNKYFNSSVSKSVRCQENYCYQ